MESSGGSPVGSAGIEPVGEIVAEELPESAFSDDEPRGEGHSFPHLRAGPVELPHGARVEPDQCSIDRSSVDHEVIVGQTREATGKKSLVTGK